MTAQSEYQASAPLRGASPPGWFETACILALQIALIAVLGGGESNGFGVFHAPAHDLYPPLIAGAAINLATFAALVYWIIPNFSQRRDAGAFALQLAIAVAANIAAQVAAQSALIALIERAPKGVGTGELALENTYGALAVLIFSLLYRVSSDWIAHQRSAARMTERVANLEIALAGMREEIAHLRSGADGISVDLGAGKGARRYPADDVLFLKAAGNYTELHTRTQVVTIYGALKTIAEQLPQARFVRIHRSYVVNLSHVRALQSGEAVLDETRLPIGAQQRRTAADAWANWRGG